MEVKSSEAVPESEVKNLLKKRKDEEELEYERAQALEHADKFVKSKPTTIKKLVEELRKNEKIPLETAIKIADIMPKRVSTLKAILIKDKVELSDEELDGIVKLTAK